MESPKIVVNINGITEYVQYLDMCSPPVGRPPSDDNLMFNHHCMQMSNIWQPNQDSFRMAEKPTLMSQLAMRMRWGSFRKSVPEGVPVPLAFDFIAAHESSEKVFVMIVKGNEQITLEDQLEMFPSDTLVGKLRLLEQ